MIRLILNDEHMTSALVEALALCRRRLFIATANVKDLHLAGPRGGGRARSILHIFEELSQRGVEINLLHSGVPSGPFLARLKKRVPDGLTMRRCPRVHAKAVIADGKWMYMGSANLTGAGLGAKSARRRNFEAGIWTDELTLIDGVLDMLQTIWDGSKCGDCGRKDFCPQPLEEPRL
jgi:phosphatidylserine/phosphatidylglycerophosphate/cardiolipin synthase-like enzyme